MKELLQSIFTSTNERIKNPFISAFCTSWIIFNWQPIFLMIFSSKIIEDKIDIITKNHNDIWNLLFYPLISSIFYILILPYINMFFEIILEFSKSKRNNIQLNSQRLIINNKQELAIEEIKFEEAKTEYRERNNHNKMIEDLQKNYMELEKNLFNEREKNSEYLKDFNNEINKIQEIHQKEAKQYKNQISNLNIEINHMREKLFEEENRINSYRDNKILKRLRINDNEEEILMNDGTIMMKRKGENNNSFYVDKTDGSIITEKEFNKRYNK